MTPAKPTDKPYKPPHERMNGPWDAYDLEEGARHLHRAHEISKNPKYMAAIHAHAVKKAEEQKQMAYRLEMLAKSGRISDKVREKMEKS